MKTCGYMLQLKSRFWNSSYATVIMNVSTRGSDREFMVKLWRSSKALLMCVTSFEDY